MSHYVSFPNWIDQLNRDCTPKSNAWAITLRWYLGWCKRRGQLACIDSARAFMDEALKAKQPKPGIEKEWKTAINWFFKHGQRKCLKPQSKSQTLQRPQSKFAKFPSKPAKQWNRPRPDEPSANWHHEAVRLIRVRQYQ
ncbi:hypothetical protein [Cerasicoccus arenae]|uniref:Uncharacterized protein n=1 Tax=Cerasicoccus arenae TaxID=424488 RepID=A0A8J3DCQ6_9BACT|nr:hypothetical protein [Cerasicoccus arenae]MBK1859695.1 hypothetical protein [Cerasicoccus arenae]GHC03762.1 hypothetical protein GCM10007047_20560 [Cerasicoccus arenae]